jgi:uncharacterized protein (TIGR02996 family)
MRPSDEAERFEQALAADPDDRAGWGAYADYLAERGDPRAELMHVQLALEDESRPAADRRALREREREILGRHEREWLGELAPHLLDVIPEYGSRTEHRCRWGFLSAVATHALSYPFAQALAAAPAARFLRELRVHAATDMDSEQEEPHPRVPLPAGVREHWQLLELIGAPFLCNLRVFQLGGGDEEPPEDHWTDCHTYAAGLEHLVAGMDHVEELHLLCKNYDADRLFALPNLTRLRVLRVYHLTLGGSGPRARPTYAYPLDVLAANRALGKLTHLQFHPHCREGRLRTPEGELRSFLPLSQVRAVLNSEHLGSLTHLQLRLSTMGDEGCREIVRSGILKRLQVLDLRHGGVTDAGARVLAECPDAARLESLDLSRNAVSPAGLNLLVRAGVRAVANEPLTDQELAEGEYLREGDFE